jgi:septum formation protein
MPLVLASASPRRQELLKNAGVEFEVRPANIPEIRSSGEVPQAFAERMAREKAEAVAKIVSTDAYVLGADTVVVVNDLVLGKPEDEQDAARMLGLLSAREHQVITGVCLLGDHSKVVRSESTAVHFRAISGEEIREYIASGEPMDKAGAYAIQGGASRWISKIQGDYSNVVGLPIALVMRMLRENGAL